MLEQDFYDQLEVSEPGKAYLALVDSCKGRVLIPEQGYEFHHIHPTSLGGLNVKANKVKFTVFEHCKAHALLAKAIPCYKTLQPLVKMSFGQIKRLTDAENVTLEECFEWSVLREKALHHPKPVETVEKISKKLKGRKLSEEHIRKRTEKRVGKVTVTDGKITRYVDMSEVEEYKKKGWYRGISENRRKRLQESHRGITSTVTGRRYVCRGEEEVRVPACELQKYLDSGWTLGRGEAFIRKFTEGMKGKTNTGKVRIKKDGMGKIVAKSELQNYLDEGWILGIARKTV